MGRRRLEKTSVPGVYRIAGDGRYLVRAYATCPKTGLPKERRKTLPSGASMADARRALADLKGEIEDDGEGERPRKMPRMAECVESWIAWSLATGRWNVNSGTAGTVASRLELHVLPFFGDMLVDRMTWADFERFIEWLITERGLSKTSAGPIYSAARSLHKFARRRVGLALMEYPATPKPPKKGDDMPLTFDERDHPMALTRDELARFLVVAEADDPIWFAMCVLGFSSGARWSEVTACFVGDFKLDDEVGIWLARRHWVPNQKAILPGIKGYKNGKRRELDPLATAVLRPYWTRRRLHGDEALMFPPVDRRATVRPSQSVQGFLDRVTKAAGLQRLTSKTLRRTFTTLSHHQTMVDVLTQAQLGHASPEQSMAYVEHPKAHREEHARRRSEVVFGDFRKKSGT